MATVSLNPAIAAEEVVRYSLENPDEFKVVSGEATLDHSSDGYRSPGTVTLRGLQVTGPPGRYLSRHSVALVSVGTEFHVVPDSSYYLSAWIKALGKREWDSKTQARTLVKWYDSGHNEIGSFAAPWAFGDYDWLEYGNAGVAPANAVVAQTFMEARISSLGPLAPGWSPTTFLFNDLTVSRTPLIAIRTGKQCNLIFEGEPLTLEVTVDDIPEGFEDALLEGVVFDYWRSAVDTFELPFNLTDGGPVSSTETLSLYAYKVIFEFVEFNAGAAIVVVQFLVIFALSLVYILTLRAKD